MDLQAIQKELEKIRQAPYAVKSDKQLKAYDNLSEAYKAKYKGKQPIALSPYNDRTKRRCKITIQDAREIRSKYNPYFYGKLRLSREFGVSPSVILRIIRNQTWKETNL